MHSLQIIAPEMRFDIANLHHEASPPGFHFVLWQYVCPRSPPVISCGLGRKIYFPAQKKHTGDTLPTGFFLDRKLSRR